LRYVFQAVALPGDEQSSEYTLGGRYQGFHFQATIGQEDGSTFDVKYEVYLDDIRVVEKHLGTGPTVAVDCELGTQSRLRLTNRTEGGSAVFSKAVAVWGDAELIHAAPPSGSDSPCKY